MFMSGKINMEDSVMITNLRHKDALIKADDSLRDALSTIDMGMPEDCLSIDLTNAYKYLGEITGESVQDDLIKKIFSQFCLGK